MPDPKATPKAEATPKAKAAPKRRRQKTTLSPEIGETGSGDIEIVSYEPVEKIVEKETLSPQAKARFGLAVGALSAIVALIIAAAGVYYLADDTAAKRHDAAKDIFEFAKTTLPPIVTLILGYYFATERREGD